MAQPETRIYRQPPEVVFNAVVKAVRDLGYKIDSMDRANGLLNFKTGMSMKSWAGQEMSAVILDNGNGTTELSLTGNRSQSGVIIQVYDWGEAKAIAGKLFERVQIYFPAQNTNPPPIIPVVPASILPPMDSLKAPPIIAVPQNTPFAFQCPHCCAELEADSSKVGAMSICPACNKEIRIQS
jgi:hypothetical protein